MTSGMRPCVGRSVCAPKGPGCGPWWCRGRDLNSYGIAPTAPSRQRVYLFHHLGIGRAGAQGHRLAFYVAGAGTANARGRRCREHEDPGGGRVILTNAPAGLSSRWVRGRALVPPVIVSQPE